MTTINIGTAICLTAGCTLLALNGWNWWSAALIPLGIIISEYHDSEANRLAKEQLRLQNTQLLLQNAHQEMINNALRRKLKL